MVSAFILLILIEIASFCLLGDYVIHVLQLYMCLLRLAFAEQVYLKPYVKDAVVPACRSSYTPHRPSLLRSSSIPWISRRGAAVNESDQEP